MRRCTVVLIDGSSLFRAGTREALEASGRYAILGEASSAHDGIAVVDRLRPDIVALDVDLPGVSGIQVAGAIAAWHPRAALVFLSAGIDDERLEAAVGVGAVAFLTKDSDGDALVDALDRVAGGENLLPPLVFARPELAGRVLAQFRGPETADRRGDVRGLPRPLTPRQTQVLDGVARGWSNRRIAEALCITEQTAKNYVTDLLRALGVNDRGHAVVRAVQAGLVQLGSLRPARAA